MTANSGACSRTGFVVRHAGRLQLAGQPLQNAGDLLNRHRGHDLMVGALAQQRLIDRQVRPNLRAILQGRPERVGSVRDPGQQDVQGLLSKTTWSKRS